MDYQKYKKSLTNGCIRLLLLGFVVAVLWLLCESPLKNAVPGLKTVRLSDGMLGFITGSFAGFLGALAYYLIYTIRMIRNPELLKRRYQRICDERELFISRQTCSLTFKISVITVYLAMIVSAVFSIIVFFTLFAVFALLIAVYLLCRLYYRRKY